MPAIDVRLLATAILAALALASCAKPHPRPAQSLVLGTFDGVLPCADCGGLDTRLTLVEDRPGASGGTYFLSEDYIGKSPKPFESSGRWTTLKGNAKNPDAVIYALDPDKPERVRYFLRRDDGSLLTLDRERNEIDAPFDLSLKPRESMPRESAKGAAGLANPAAVNCARQGGRSEIRTDTAGGQYGVCIFSDGRACEEWPLFRDGTCVKAKG